jgi:hypothetical protein
MCFLLIVLGLLFPCQPVESRPSPGPPATAAEPGDGGDEPAFDYETFYARLEVATWLKVYDTVAWHTSDLVMQEPPEILEQLGPSWFCLEIDGTWHAVYGSYDPDSDRFTVVLHYAAGPDGFAPSTESLPRSDLRSFPRALHTVGLRLSPVLVPTDVRFNTYVRRLPDRRIEVWYVPAWQTDGRLVYGTEYRLVTNKTGSKILEEMVPEPALVTDRPDPEAPWFLPNSEAEVPSVGQIFTILVVRDFVPLAAIRSRDYTTTLIDIPATGGKVWVHVYNEHDLEESIQAIQRLEAEGVQE